MHLRPEPHVIGLGIALLTIVLLPAGLVVAQQEETGDLAAERVERRLFDGAPPVMPHEEFGDCVDCHYEEGTEVPDVGFAPASPHANLAMRCVQCHAAQTTDDIFVENAFVALRRGMMRGERSLPGAPPVIPHGVFMRDNCTGCHAGEGAREWIRTSHPERVRCLQCHVEQRTSGQFGG